MADLHVCLTNTKNSCFATRECGCGCAMRYIFSCTSIRTPPPTPSAVCVPCSHCSLCSLCVRCPWWPPPTGSGEYGFSTVAILYTCTPSRLNSAKSNQPTKHFPFLNLAISPSRRLAVSPSFSPIVQRGSAASGQSRRVRATSPAGATPVTAFPGSAATSTSHSKSGEFPFSRISHLFLSSMPPHTRRGIFSTYCSCCIGC